MANLRLIHDNAADRATVAASTTAGALVAANMLTDVKTEVHRSTGTSVTYTLTWTAFETLGGVALPATNLSAQATIRVRAYSAAVGGTLLADTGTVYACPGLNLGMWNWSMPLNANAFAYGGASKTSVWLPAHVAARRMVIDLVDDANAAGYIDCARIVAGAYWEPVRNARWGAEYEVVDLSTSSRNEAGDLKTDRAPHFDAVKFDFARMPPEDRHRLAMLMNQVGSARKIFLSLLPDWADPVLCQQMQIFGKRQGAPIRFEGSAAHTSSMTIQGW